MNERSGSPYLNVALDNEAALRFRALLDSGATHSIISMAAMDKLANRVGTERVSAWVVHNLPGFTVVVGDGKVISPAGAVVLTVGVRLVAGGDVWMRFPFLVMDDLTEEIILGSDWEAETSATHFTAAGLLGLSLAVETQAAYAGWAQRAVGAAGAKDIPALGMSAFSHFAKVDRVSGPYSTNFTRTLVRAIPEEDHASPVAMSVDGPLPSAAEPLASNATPEATDAPPIPNPTVDSAVNRAPAAAPLASLRAMRAFVVPPHSEVGPVAVNVCWRTHRRPA